MTSMLPAEADNLDPMSFQTAVQPGLTYRLDREQNRVRGMTDKREAVGQAVYLILNTERYAYPIYSRAYGVELAGLIGRPADYAMSEVKRRITQALTQDDRITGVENWRLEAAGRRVLAAFTVKTVYGDLEIVQEVEI